LFLQYEYLTFIFVFCEHLLCLPEQPESAHLGPHLSELLPSLDLRHIVNLLHVPLEALLVSALRPLLVIVGALLPSVGRRLVDWRTELLVLVLFRLLGDLLGYKLLALGNLFAHVKLNVVAELFKLKYSLVQFGLLLAEELLEFVS
jgi:hypothetical protein